MKPEIKEYIKYLNKEHGLKVGSDAQKNGSKRGQRKRLYGDYLYHSDRILFMVSLKQDLESGAFKLTAGNVTVEPKSSPRASPEA